MTPHVVERLYNEITTNPCENVNTVFSVSDDVSEAGHHFAVELLLRAAKTYLENRSLDDTEAELKILFAIGTCLTNKGRANVSIPIFEKILKIAESDSVKFGDVLPAILIHYGSANSVLGNYKSAFENFRKAANVAEQNNGKISVAHAKNNLARNLISTCSDDQEEIEELLSSAFAIRKQELGSLHPDTIATQINLISLRYDRGYFEEAKKEMEVVCKSIYGYHGETLIEYPNACSLVAMWSAKNGEYQEAIEYYQKEISSLESLNHESLERINSSKNSIRLLTIASDENSQITQAHIQMLFGKQNYGD